jgi:hypothetical protein
VLASIAFAGWGWPRATDSHGRVPPGRLRETEAR